MVLSLIYVRLAWAFVVVLILIGFFMGGNGVLVGSTMIMEIAKTSQYKDSENLAARLTSIRDGINILWATIYLLILAFVDLNYIPWATFCAACLALIPIGYIALMDTLQYKQQSSEEV